MIQGLRILQGPITLIGHPFSTVGMGEQLRSHMRACQSAQVSINVVDIFGHSSRSDPEHRKLVEPVEVNAPPPGLRIFHINGDEVARVLDAFAERGGSLKEGYNVIVPAWELPKYPTAWAKELRRFDEVWAISHFIRKSLAAAGVDSTFVGQPVEVPLGYFLPRKYFGIRESAFVLLSFLDLSSYSSRKNPEGVLALFDALARRRELDDIQLVLKAKNADQDADEWLKPFRLKARGVHFISRPLSALETRSLINSCDCFVSLHRSEGFGRCTGEAMFLGRLALATAWSGNLDHMSAENSLLVDHRLTSIAKGQYPFGQGQSWAEPSIDHALKLIDSVIDDPQLGRSIAEKGRRDVRLLHSFRAVGVRILDRIQQIEGNVKSRTAAWRTPGSARKPPRSVDEPALARASQAAERSGADACLAADRSIEDQIAIQPRTSKRLR